jgi:hypothetical protein
VRRRIFIAQLWERAKQAGSQVIKPGRPAAMLCAGLFACGTLARSLEIPSADVWVKGEPLTWALVASGLVTALAGVVNLRSARHRTRDRGLAEGCQLLAAHVDEKCEHIALRDVEVLVWLVVGPPFGRHLVKAQDFVLGSRLQDSGVTWVRGKGVIGRCWELQAPVSVNLLKDFYPNATGETAFETLSERDRFAFSWRELEATRHYEAVWAAPLRSAYRARVVGIVCVGLRAESKSSGHDRAAELDGAWTAENGNLRDEVSTILAKCEAALRDAE